MKAHVCRECRHAWESPDVATAAGIEEAGKGFGGPLCGLCYHLEMASRYAEYRGGSLAAAVQAREARKGTGGGQVSKEVRAAR